MGNADSLVPNPHIKRGRPMKYFETARVHSVKAREVFEEETQVSLQRKQAVQKVLEEKMQALVELAKTVDPALPDWSIAELDAQARQLSGMLADEGSPGRDLFLQYVLARTGFNFEFLHVASVAPSLLYVSTLQRSWR